MEIKNKINSMKIGIFILLNLGYIDFIYTFIFLSTIGRLNGIRVNFNWIIISFFWLVGSFLYFILLEYKDKNTILPK